MRNALKRIGCGALLALAVCTPLRGRCGKLPVEWGLMGGLNVPGYSTDMSGADVSNRAGWQVGLFTSLKFGLVSVDPQLFYVHQKFRLRSDGEGYILKARSVDLPVTVSLDRKSVV